jgi:microcin C transport system permease protein
MTAYIIRRLLLVIPTFLGITVLVFTITRFVPGGPIERMIAEQQAMQADKMSTTDGIGGGALSEKQLQELKEYYGFDKPVLVSYVHWLGKVLKGDLGRSTRYGEPVWHSIRSRFPISIFYGVVTMILTYTVCVPLGVVKALRHKTFLDNSTSILVFVGYAVPGFVVGILLLLLFAAHWEWFPLGGFTGEDFDELSTFGKVKDILYHACLPLIAYLSGSFAFMTLLMKNSLMDNLAADYVRTALAKGQPFRKAVFKHAMRNSLIPLATHFGNNISIIIAGSFLIETVFNIDGIGLLGYESIVERDYPVVMGVLVISSLLYLIGNILSDICVAIVDPRVKFS